MKPTQLLDLFRSIFRTFFLFLCICMVTSLGTISYCGLSYTTDGMNDMADRYYESVNYADLTLYAPLGFSDEELSALRSSYAGITDMKHGYITDELFSTAEGELVARIFNNPEGMNTPTLLSGSLPETGEQCLIETATAERFGLKEGDKIELSRPSGALLNTTLTVCGIAQFAQVTYINNMGNRGATTLANGEVTALMIVGESAFDTEYYSDPPYCYITLDTSLGVTTDEYTEYVSSARESILQTAKQLQLEKFAPLSGEYETALSEAEAKYESSLSEYSDKEAEYEDNAAKLREAEAQLKKAENSLSKYEGTNEYAKYKAQYDSLKAEYDVSKTLLDTYASRLSESKDALYSAKLSINASASLLELLKAGFVSAETINDNFSFSTYVASTDTVAAVISSCSILFLCVALLIIYTTISRMVTDESRLIGTQKALGFSSGRIRRKYILYSAICTIFGVGCGAVFSYYKMQLFIYSAGFEDGYYIKDYVLAFDWAPVVVIAVLELTAAVTAAYFACLKLTRQPAVVLMNTDGGAEEWGESAAKNRPAQEKLPFGFRITLRNIFTDRKMLITTVIGVAGCLMLLLSTFNARYAVTSAVDVQYNEIQKYDGVAVLSDDTLPSEKAEFEKMLSESFIVDTMNVSESYGKFETDNSSGYLTYICPAYNDCSSFLQLRDVKTGSGLAVPEEGMLLSCRLAEDQGLKVGDTIYVINTSGQRCQTFVAGIFEWHFGSAAVLAPDYWEKLTGQELPMTQYYVRLLNTGKEAFASAADGHDCFLSFTDTNLWEETITKRLVGYDRTILIMSLLSFVMAVFVIFNLAKMNITRKLRELTVMKTMGFSTRHLCNYVFSETMLMSVLGLLVGTLAGSLVAYYIAGAVESAGVYNVHAVFPQAVLISVFITFAFYTAANLISLLAIRKIKMTQTTRG